MVAEVYVRTNLGIYCGYISKLVNNMCTSSNDPPPTAIPTIVKIGENFEHVPTSDGACCTGKEPKQRERLKSEGVAKPRNIIYPSSENRTPAINSNPRNRTVGLQPKFCTPLPRTLDANTHNKCSKIDGCEYVIKRSCSYRRRRIYT